MLEVSSPGDSAFADIPTGRQLAEPFSVVLVLNPQFPHSAPQAAVSELTSMQCEWIECRRHLRSAVELPAPSDLQHSFNCSRLMPSGLVWTSVWYILTGRQLAEPLSVVLVLNPQFPHSATGSRIGIDKYAGRAPRNPLVSLATAVRVD